NNVCKQTLRAVSNSNDIFCQRSIIFQLQGRSLVKIVFTCELLSYVLTGEMMGPLFGFTKSVFESFQQIFD
ncbi:MAG: hypothetical protein WCE25_12950, partial [Nitrososphaeraceae archaeon]